MQEENPKMLPRRCTYTETQSAVGQICFRNFYLNGRVVPSNLYIQKVFSKAYIMQGILQIPPVTGYC